MKRVIATIIFVVICLGVGYTASLFQAGSIHTWYPALVKPSITPPDAVFPIAWSVIYVMMGLSIGLTWDKPAQLRNPLIEIFVIQLLLNFLWSFSFFYMHSPTLGFANIAVLDIAVIWYISSACKVNRLSAWLFIPYALWLGLATYLNYYIMVNN